MDLNELVSRAIGISAPLSPIILFLCVILFFYKHSYTVTYNKYFKNYLLVFAVIIIYGGILALIYGDWDNIYSQYRYFGPSLIVFTVSYGIGYYHKIRNKIHQPLTVLLIVISINAILILISSVFNIDFHGSSIANIDRAVGLYSNPNRAGLVCCVGQSLSVFLLLNRNSVGNKYYIFTYYLCLLACIATFSKGAIIISTALIINIIIIGKNMNYNRFDHFSFFKKTLIISGIIAFLNIAIILNTFSYEQLSRYYELGNFLKGEITVQTTTQRSTIIKEALLQISENWIIGNGIGAYERFYYGFGTHNEFLQIWGNYGILGLLVYLSYFTNWFLKTISLDKRTEVSLKTLSYNMILIFLLASFISHTVVSSKQFSLVLGLLFSSFQNNKKIIL